MEPLRRPTSRGYLEEQARRAVDGARAGGTHLVGGSSGGDRAARADCAAADFECGARRVRHREHRLAPSADNDLLKVHGIGTRFF